MKLDHNILVRSTASYQGRLSEVTVDIRKGDVVSNHPVVVQLLPGRLNANRLRIVNNGGQTHFAGGVSMVPMLNKKAADSAPAHGAQP